MKHYIYTAGPITGCTYEGCTDWRDYAAKNLDSAKIECLSPMRGKDHLKGKGPLSAGTYDGTLTSQKGIMGRDHFDCTRASAVLMNLKDTKKVSIGTVMEAAWAYDRQIPVVLVMEKGNLHEHVMFNETFTYRVNTLEEAVDVLRILFNEVQ